MLGTGIERDIFLHYFIMILCIFAIFILFHMSDDKFIFILYLFALECRFKGAHLSAMYFFFFWPYELFRKEELCCEEQGVRE